MKINRNKILKLSIWLAVFFITLISFIFILDSWRSLRKNSSLRSAQLQCYSGCGAKCTNDILNMTRDQFEASLVSSMKTFNFNMDDLKVAMQKCRESVESGDFNIGDELRRTKIREYHNNYLK